MHYTDEIKEKLKFIQIDEIQTLPSGVRVDVKPWKTKEVTGMAAGKSLLRRTEMGFTAIERCRLIEDPLGVYEGKMGLNSKLRPIEMHVGDITALTILQRIMSKGAYYEFSLPNEQNKKKPFEFELDLRRFLVPFGEKYEFELPDEIEYVTTEDGDRAVIYPPLGMEPILLDDLDDEDGKESLDENFFNPISSEMIEVFRNSNERYLQFQDQGFTWKPLYGSDTIAVSEKNPQTDEAILNAVIIQMFESVDGVKDAKIGKWVLNSDSRFSDMVKSKHDKFQFGIRVEVEIEDPSSGQLVRIPVDTKDPSFFT